MTRSVRKKTLIERFGIAAAFIVSLLILVPSHFSFADNPPVKIGVLAKRGIVRCTEKWTPTAEYLTAKIPGSTFVIVPIDSDGAFSFVEHGTIDFVLANPSVYVELESLYGVNRIATLKNHSLDDAHTKYCGVVFCRANRSDMLHLSDLKGKSFMAVKETSFGGWIMAWREFKENNIDPHRDFKELRFGGTHDTVVYAVRDGKVDAGTVRTDTLENMKIEGKINLADFLVIHEHEGDMIHLPFLHSTRSYPEWPFARVKHTPDELAEKVATALLEMPKSSPAAKAARCAGWTIPLNYQSVHECLRELKVGPYRDLGKITFTAVFKKYREWMLAIVILFVILAGAVIYILRLNRGIKGSHVKLQKEVEERKQVEEALRESEERFRDISYSMADWVWEVDKDGKYTFASESAKEILGYDCEELIGKTPFELMPEDEAERIREFFRIVAREKKPIIDLENWNITKEGKRVCLLTNAVPMLNKQGEIFGYRGVDKDITERKLAEEALIKAETKYRKLFEAVPVGLYRTTMEGEILDANPALIQLLGYPDLQTLKKVNTKDIVHPEDRDRTHALLERQGVVHDFELRVRKRDATVIYVRDRVRAVRDAIGRMIYQEGSLEDITERKQAEEALKESESRYRTLVESSTDAILMMDKERNLVHFNKAFLGLFGYRKGEINGRSIRIIHPSEESYDVFERTAYPVIDKHGYFRTEWEFMRKDGTIFPVESVTSPLRSFDGTIEGYIAVIRDIAERKRAEEERIRLATAIEQAAESVVITDRHGTIQYVNPAFEYITGYSRQEAVGQNSKILKSDKLGKEFYADMWDTITSGRVWKGHLINKKMDGRLYEEEATISPIKNASGEIINFVAVKRDVTEEIKLEGKLRQAQKMEAIGTLAGGIAHDFNNILSAIIGYTELAEYDMPEGSKTRNNLREVLNAGRRAKDLVQQILAFSRQGDQERKPMQITHIVKEALKLMRASLPSTIEIRRNIESDLGIVLADPTQIHQILMNLCTNAAQAMNNNGGVLEVGIKNVAVGNQERRFLNAESEKPEIPNPEYPQDVSLSRSPAQIELSPGPYVRLTVSDTGCGMSNEVMERIFDPYFTTKEKGEGTGLGLSVVHGIVKSHGGAIAVYSEAGRGSTFSIYFPAIEKEVAQEKQTSEIIPTGHQRIFFVDDEPALVDIGKKMLEHLGHKVFTRTSSLEALEAFRNNPDKFDLVITDKTMPQMTGFDLAQEIKGIRPDIPIILCTGFSDTTDADKARAVGIGGLVMKPIVIREMAETINRVLELA
ncbi:MAG: PAS domain S-box protein [Desulfobacteraceae bacterium]|nr:MAG: PAS domain S-box protein [Desulfobacteraceae bacterium]